MTFISGTSGGSQVRSPRVWLTLNGARLPCLAATVTRKSERSADTFSAELTIDQTAPLGMGLAEWADYQPTDVQIVMATQADGGDETIMIVGQVDEPRIHWQNMTVSVLGRDKSASLTEKRRSEKFQNQTSGDIVSKIAQDHGLSPAIQAVSDFAGKIYDQDTVHLIMNRSDHEVMSDLAEREGNRWYVDGSTLYFEPKGTDSGYYALTWYPPGTQAPYGVASFTDLETHRNMTAARPHQMAIRSWHHKDKRKYDGVNNSDGVGDTVEVEHHHNGKNQDQVDRLSKSRLKEAIRHDCNIVARAPGDLNIDVRQKLQLTGTGTVYDQLYDIDEIEFQMSWRGSFEMTIMGKIAKSGRSGSDDTGATNFSAPSGSGGVGSDAVAGSQAQPSLTPAGTSGIGRN